MDILDFQYVACGNEQWKHGNATCDHGPEECFGNLVEECVRNTTAYDPVAYMPFVVCLEGGSGLSITQPLVDKCLAKTKIDPVRVNACVKGPLGKTLMAHGCAEIPSDYMYVPWIVSPTGTTMHVTKKSQIIQAACDFWKGAKPSFCKED